MSKFEILQNNKIKKEIQVLDKYSNKATDYNLKLNNYLVFMFAIPDLVFFIITFFVLLFLTKFELSYSWLISFFMILSILKANMSQSIDFFKNFTKNLYQVQKMWHLFDNGKEIAWLYEWKNFEYKKGDIEIKNLHFSYWENAIFEDFSLKVEGSKKQLWIVFLRKVFVNLLKNYLLEEPFLS